MALQTLSNPVVNVNGADVGIVPNSVSYKRGTGDRKIKSQATGGVSQPIVTIDAETKISVVKFKMHNTEANFTLVEEWSALNGVTVTLTEGVLFSAVFNGMIIINDPEFTLGVDGEVEVEFNGAPEGQAAV